MKKFLTGMACVVALTAITVVVFAQCRDNCPQGKNAAVCAKKGKAKAANWQKQLGLTAEQTKKLDALRAHSKMRPLAAKLQSKVQALRKLQAAEKPDAKAIAAAKSEVAALRGQLRKARLAYHEAVGKVLTAGQKQKLAALGACPLGPCNCPGNCPDEGSGCQDGCGGPAEGVCPLGPGNCPSNCPGNCPDEGSGCQDGCGAHGSK